MATRLTIRTYAREKADQTNSTFPSDAEYNDFIDKAGRKVWRKMMRAGWKPDRTTLNITLTGSPTPYNIGTDVYIVHSVFRVDGTQRIPLSRIKPEELDGALTQNTGNQAIWYDLIGGATSALTIEFYPNQPTGTIEVRYTKRFPGFTADGDTWFGPEGSDELLSLDAAMAGLLKEGDPSIDLKGEYEELYQQICEESGWVDSQGQQTIRDVRNLSRKRDASDWNAGEGWF